MDKEKTAIVLGGTLPHITLIKKLKLKGYKVILVDYLKDSPCIEYADKHVVASTLDKDSVLKIAQYEKADIVISTCIDQANSTCCYVAEKLNLPHPYSYETSLDVTDKGRMKTKFKKFSIKSSDFIVISDLSDLKNIPIKYPLVVKPVDCNSSKGVHKVNNEEELNQYAIEALSLSRSNRAIIEKYVRGKEIQVDCLATNDETVVLMTRQKKHIKDIKGEVLQSTGSIIPAPLSEEEQKQVDKIAKLIPRAFGLRNTPFFFQAIVEDDIVYVLEFAPRIGGGLSFYLMDKIVGIDIVDCAINSFIDKNIKF